MKNKKLKKVLSIIIYGVVGFFAAFGVFCFGGLMYSKATGQLDDYLDNNKSVQVTPNTYTNFLPKLANNTSTPDDHNLCYLSFGDFGNASIVKSLVYKTCEYANRLSSFENGLNDLSNNANGPVVVSDYDLSIGELYFIDDSNTSHRIYEAYFQITDSPYSNFKILSFWCADAHNSAGYLRIDSYFNPVSYTGLYSYLVDAYSMLHYTITTYGHSNISYPSCQILTDMTNANNNVSNIIFGWDYFATQNDTFNYNLGYNQGYDNGVIVGKAEGIDEGYSSGYDDGLHENDAYNLGYTDGHTTGKTEGYNEGYATGSTGMNSNPFNLIANAFTSVASILNIQVLPNLTLGVLIFTPLIVLIIITVVKFIRG